MPIDSIKIRDFLIKRIPECAVPGIAIRDIGPGEVWFPLPPRADKPEHVIAYAAIEQTVNHVYWRAQIRYEVISGLAEAAGVIHGGQMRIARPTEAGSAHRADWVVSPGTPRQIISLDKSQPVIVRMSGFTVIVRMSGFTEDGKTWLEDRYDLG